MASKSSSAQTISGHFELTRLLIPQLVAAGGARIVILSSDGHRMSDVDLDDPNWERRDYDKFVAYGASKTANILHMVELDRRLRDRGVRAYSVHPGVVATSLARHMTRDDFTTLNRIDARNTDPGRTAIDVRRDFTMPEHGAATQVWAAVSPELAGRRVRVSRGLRGPRRTSRRTRSTRRTRWRCGSSRRGCASTGAEQ